MTFQQLRIFTAVAQLENFSKASDFLHISQSSLSKQISKLESELGVSLFDRKGKKVTLNMAGMAFYDSSTRILREMHTAEDNLRFLVRGQNHHIRIGASSLPDDFPDFIAEFEKTRPEAEFTINVRIESLKPSDINEYDVLICPEEYRFEKLNGYHLFDEGYYYAVPAGTDTLGENTFSANMLDVHTVVFIQEDAFTPEYPFHVCSALGGELKTAFFTDSREVHRRMISSGAACGFVPKTESSAYKQDKNIRLLRILDKRFVRPMKICFLREKHLSELGKDFMSFILEHYRPGENDRIRGIKK